MKTEAETGLSQPHAKERLESLENGRGQEGPWRERSTADSLSLDFWLP